MDMHAVHVVQVMQLFFARHTGYAFSALLAWYGGMAMPDVRASLSVEWHKELKKEAADEGVPIKDLVARILMQHLQARLKEQGKSPSKGKRLFSLPARGDGGG